MDLLSYKIKTPYMKAVQDEEGTVEIFGTHSKPRDICLSELFDRQVSAKVISEYIELNYPFNSSKL